MKPKVSNAVSVPAKPRQGDVVEWWTMQHHPGSSYVQRHRATYYESATCRDVLGKDHTHGRDFCREWHVQTWYEPSGERSVGGRNTTDGLRDALTTGPSGGSTHATWEGARDAAIENIRRRAAEFRSMAHDLDRKAAALEKAPTPLHPGIVKTFTLMLVVLVGLAHDAAADPAAENLYAEGQTAYERADYSTAIAKWQASYALSGENALLFNIAQAYRLSGNCLRAIASYQSYVAADPAADQRTLAEDLVRELRGRCSKSPPKPAPEPRPTTKAASPAIVVPIDQPPPAPRVDTAIDRPTPRRSALQVAGLITGGGGLVVLATGLLIGHHAQALGDEITAACAQSCNWTDQKSKDAAGRRYATIGGVLDIVGITAIAGGAVMYYLGRKSPVTIAPTREGATVAWGGSW